MVAEIGRVVYDNGVYEAHIIEINEGPSVDEFKPLIVYGVFNIDTSVREAELRSYAQAVTWCDQLADSVAKLHAEAEEDDLILDAMPKCEASDNADGVH